jgi:hypothetical protein
MCQRDSFTRPTVNPVSIAEPPCKIPRSIGWARQETFSFTLAALWISQLAFFAICMNGSCTTGITSEKPSEPCTGWQTRRVEDVDQNYDGRLAIQ